MTRPSKEREQEIMKLAEEMYLLDALDADLVDEEELEALGLDEGPDHYPCRIGGIRQQRIQRAIEKYGQEQALSMELATSANWNAVARTTSLPCASAEIKIYILASDKMEPKV